MTRVSGYFDLGVTQGGLDFVDVDVIEDVPVYIDPTAIRSQSGAWVEKCQESLRSFFGELVIAIKNEDRRRIEELIFPLVEPNETHLGESEGRSSGRGLGNQKKARELVESLASSEAVRSGYLADLEDTALFVPGIDKDIVSDITTSVIRLHLVEYTQKMCAFYGIPTEYQQSGPYWDAPNRQWDSDVVLLPRGVGDKLLLVPKSIVRVKLTVDKGRYYRGYLRPYFEQIELDSATSGLVRVLKDKTKRVDLKRLDSRLGTDKISIAANTQKFPVAVEEYRRAVAELPNSPLPDERLRVQIGTPPVDLRGMLDELKAIQPGNGGATLYHRAIAKIFTALFDTYLANCRIEEELHNGLKRIDVLFDNVASEGFFRWLALHRDAATIVVECKNYGREVANPEFDQIAMRLAPGRGIIGLLTVRSLADKTRALQRAKNIANDGHGYVIVLDDDDIEDLVSEYEEHAGAFSDDPRPLALLRRRFDDLTGF